MEESLSCEDAKRILQGEPYNSMDKKPSLVSEIQQQGLSEWKQKCYISHANVLELLNVYYSHIAMGKSKYKWVRTCNRSKCVLYRKIITIWTLVLLRMFKKYGYAVCPASRFHSFIWRHNRIGPLGDKF